jgi:hypothetical protein
MFKNFFGIIYAAIGMFPLTLTEVMPIGA